MTRQQAIYWAARVRRHPGVHAADWLPDWEGDSFFVQVTDRLGNSTRFEDVCHLRTTLFVWGDHAKTSQEKTVTSQVTA